MKRVLLALLAGFLFATPAIAQVSGFNQRGKVTQEMQADGFTMAHPSLPINSKVQVANTLTGKEIEVTVIRRITASSNRIADLSPSAWIELALTPNTEVRIYSKPAVQQPSAPPATQPAAPPAQQPSTQPVAPPPTQPAEQVPVQPAPPPVSESPETTEQLNKLLGIMMEREEREAREREEARKAKEEQEAKEREEAERIAKEEREAKEREEAERIVREAREEADRITREAREEADRIAKEIRETREREAKDMEDARLAREREEASRLAREREDAARIAREREEASRLARVREEAARIAREREEASRLAREREEASRLAREREETLSSARETAIASEAREREDAERAAREALSAYVPPPAATRPPTANPAEPTGRGSSPLQIVEPKIIPNLPNPNNGKVYNLQIGAFSSREAALDLSIKISNGGFEVVQEFTGALYRVVVTGIQASFVPSAVQRLGAMGISEIWIKER